MLIEDFYEIVFGLPYRQTCCLGEVGDEVGEVGGYGEYDEKWV